MNSEYSNEARPKGPAFFYYCVSRIVNGHAVMVPELMSTGNDRHGIRLIDERKTGV